MVINYVTLIAFALLASIWTVYIALYSVKKKRF